MGADDCFMRDSDAFSWYMERDPALRSTIVSVAWLEKSPDWGAVVDHLDRYSRLSPMVRQRPVAPPGRLATPRWSVDPDFDLSWHLRRVDAPDPHTPETVMALARTAAMTAFDPARPLWEITLVENLEGARAALLMKLHHSLTDGIAGMKLALELFDAERTPPPRPLPPEPPAGEALSAPQLVGQALAHAGRRLAGIAASGAVSAPSTALWALRHPTSAVSVVTSTAVSIGHTVAPVPDILSPVMTARSTIRDLDILLVRLADLKGAASVTGGTVNDAFMAAVTGGLRRYHEHHGTTVNELRVTLPISIRRAEDAIVGNRITLQRFAVPVGIADPADRMRAVGKRSRTAREEPSLPYTNAIAAGLNLLPPGAIRAMLKRIDFVASNVPGPQFPLYLGGARVSAWVPFSPTIGASVNVTLLSYDGTCCVGINIDSAAVPDRDALVQSLQEGFAEVIALAGDHDPVVRPLAAELFPGERGVERSAARSRTRVGGPGRGRVAVSPA